MNLGQVYTKRIVADYMVGMLTVAGKARILDPCFGRGVFIESLMENTDYAVEGIEIDPESFSSFAASMTGRCLLKNCDFFDVEGTYDGIVMNPPYVRQEEIDALAPLGVSKLKLQSSLGMMTISSKANLYMYFILRAIQLLRSGGELIAIFPDSWTNTPVGCQFREHLLHYGCITNFVDVEGEAFEGSPMVDVCILKFVKDRLVDTHHKVMRISGDTLVVEDIEKPQQNQCPELVRLKTVANIRRGITTGANKFFINPPLFTQDHLVEVLSSPKDLTGYSTRHCRLDKLLAIGCDETLAEDEQNYLHNCSEQILHQGKPQTLYDQIVAGGNWYQIKLPATSHIVFSYIVRGDMKFVLNDGNRNVRDNFYMISSNIDSLLMMALLNNYHVYCQLEQCGKKYGKGLLKLQKYDIDNIKLPRMQQLDPLLKQRLADASQKLVAGDKEQIDQITTLLNQFYGTGDAKKEFMDRKTKRLGQ